MRPRLLLLIACAKSFNSSARKRHLQQLFWGRDKKQQRRGRTTMLRNQDRPELLLFVSSNAARWSDGSARPGVERLVGEAADAGTPSIWICEDDPKSVGSLEPMPSPCGSGPSPRRPPWRRSGWPRPRRRGTRRRPRCRAPAARPAPRAASGRGTHWRGLHLPWTPRRPAACRTSCPPRRRRSRTRRPGG